MSDRPDRPTSSPNVLVLRAVFVPDGEQPPPEFASVWRPLRIPATRDPATGQITCPNAGLSFGGGIRAEWRPDEDQESDEGENAAGSGASARESGDADRGEPDGQRDQVWRGGAQPAGGGYPGRSGGRTAFGVGGDATGAASGGRFAASPAAAGQEPTGQDGSDGAVKLSDTATATGASTNAPYDNQAAPVPPAAAGQQGGPYRWPGHFDAAVKRASPFGEFAQAADKKAANTDVAGGAAAAAKMKARPTEAAAVAATKPGAANEPRDFKRFFDTVQQPISDLAKELGVPEDYILGHAAAESGWLDNHNFALNNPFGYTRAGGRNLSFSSVADAVAAYRRDYGRQIQDATSPKDFAERLEGELNETPVPGWRRYNTRDQKEYEKKIVGLIQSVARHKAQWLAQRTLAH